MYYNKYKEKLNPGSGLSTSFTTASSDKTLIIGSIEKKENTRMGKQTASVYASKIKTKIHNTSSFFKLSLKSNNKALALALVAQKQKSRELEAEVVKLRKDAQTTNFDLAFQRHKNKQLFAIIREFYDSSLTWMSKAADVFCNDEVPDTIDTEDNTSKDQMFEMEIEFENVPNRLTLCPKSSNVQSEPVDTAMVKGTAVSDASNQEEDHLEHQNTLYDSKMDITISDNAAAVVTVETNARRSPRVTDGHQKKIDLISGVEDSPVELTSAVPKDITTVTQRCATTVQNEEKNGQETESVSARRKTHVTSRCTKSSRRTCKQKETKQDPRKTYTISKDPPNYCGSDLELQNTDFLSKAKNKAKESNPTQEPRRTFIVHDELRTQKTRKTKIPSLMKDHSSLCVVENVESASSVCPEAAGTDELGGDAAVQAKKHTNKTPAHPLSQLEKCNSQKNRGTFVIQTSHSLINRNSILNETIILEDSNKAEGSQDDVSESQTLPQCAGLDTIADQQKEPEPVSHDGLKEKACNQESSQDLHISLETSEFTSMVAGKAKKPRKEGADKAKDRKGKSKALTKKQNKCALTERPDVIDLQKEAEYLPLFKTSQLPGISHCSASEEALWDGQHAETPEISSPVDKVDQTEDVLNMSLYQSNQTQEGKGRKTYVISSSDETSSKAMAADGFSFEEHHLSNKTNVSPVMNTSMLVMEKQDMTAGRFSEYTTELQFTEERPPWENLDDYGGMLSDESCSHSPQPETRVQTINIYQDEDSILQPQVPDDGRVMKSLTNTDVNADLGRTRRRAAPVTYKEPSINSKMRRGDKYSDTKFLNSPVFKDKKKKKRNKE